MGKKTKKTSLADEMGDGPSRPGQSVSVKPTTVSASSKVKKSNMMELDTRGKESRLEKLKATLEEGRHLSNKAKRKLAAARTKEAALAAQAMQDAQLPPDERDKRQADRARMDEIRSGKAQIARLKNQINKLGKRNLHEKERRKQLAKEIKGIQGKISALTSGRPATGMEEEGEATMC